MSENIFKNSYFGKPYRTRDGRKALYLQSGFDNKHLHFLVIDKELIADCYTDSGNERDGQYESDIVSEWTE